jgi:predicted metal-dependent hydrolase
MVNSGYTLCWSRTRHLRITVHPDGRFVVSVPKNAKPQDVERFIKSKEKWVLEKQEYFKKWREKRKRLEKKRHEESLKFREVIRHKYGEFSVEGSNKTGFILDLFNPSKTTGSKAERKKQYLLHKEEAKKLVLNRLTHWQDFYAKAGIDLRYGRLSIKNQRSRWGSCSRHKDGTANLNFNWRVSQLPGIMADYIIIHELCHLKEMNHGPRFWSLVSVAMPNWKEVRGDLKKMGVVLG